MSLEEDSGLFVLATAVFDLFAHNLPARKKTLSVTIPVRFGAVGQEMPPNGDGGFIWSEGLVTSLDWAPRIGERYGLDVAFHRNGHRRFWRWFWR